MNFPQLTVTEYSLYKIMGKNKKIILAVLFSLAAIITATAAIMFSCNNEKIAVEEKPVNEKPLVLRTLYPDCWRAFPAGAEVMVRFGLNAFLEKSELLQNSDLQSLINEYKDALPEKVRAGIDAVIKNPAAAGINLSEPVVAAVYVADSSAKANVIAAIPLASRSDMVNLAAPVLKELDFEIEARDGLQYIVDPDGNALKNVVIDEKMILFTGDVPVADVINDSGERAIDNPKFSVLLESRDDVAVAFDAADVYMPPASDKAGKAFLEMLKGMHLLMSLNAEAGHLALSWDLDLPKEYSSVLSTLDKATGKHMKFVPANSIAVANARLDLNSLIKVLPKFIDNVDTVADIESMLKFMGIDKPTLNRMCTEYTVAMLASAKVGRQFAPRFVLAADCPDRAIFDKIVALVRGRMRNVAADVYALGANRYMDYSSGMAVERVAGYDYYLAYCAGTLLILPEDIYKKGLSANGIQGNARGSQRFADLKGRAAFADIAGINREFRSGALKADKQLMDIVSILHSTGAVKNATIGVDKLSNVELRLNFNDKSNNSLKVIADIIFSIVNNNMNSIKK